MFNKYLSYIFTIALIFSISFVGKSQETEVKENTKKFIVGITGSEPFAFDKMDEQKGIAVEIWEKMADDKDWKYEYIYFESVDEALKSVDNGEIDIVVGPVSITSNRVEYLRFSQPFYNSSLAIVSRADKLNFWDKIKPFFSLNLLYAVFVFLFILAIVGTLLWLAERNASPDQFPHDPINGIGTGMWLALVTMSTVGYGDRAPVTLIGRIIAGSWMVISIIFATSMVAGIASTLTISSIGNSTITNIEELSGKKAATIKSSPSALFLKENKVSVLASNDLEEAMEMLKNKEVDAVVYDRPQLLYYMSENQKENLHLAKAEYYKQGYGFAFKLSSDLVYEINRSLLTLAEEQEVVKIVENYLDKDE
ncbi:ABC transporter substrate-binding protein [Brumimicrobium salinarum]|uniref:ABC transporter substrate-binding protein n=1 Tax=Brumimicrobium salinarum TaxID=2058658 RepID=A0A2I0QZL4_9FLAO|nr:transporter substrate-binding domain-containing protein [Brumimicrobium salinarum]PKR79747.1 ABC transporter substrate-binding protein [Brumimicrobium salinarum]